MSLQPELFTYAPKSDYTKLVYAAYEGEMDRKLQLIVSPRDPLRFPKFLQLYNNTLGSGTFGTVLMSESVALPKIFSVDPAMQRETIAKVPRNDKEGRTQARHEAIMGGILWDLDFNSGGSLRHHLVPFYSFGVWVTQRNWDIELSGLDLDDNSKFLLYPKIGPVPYRTARYDVAGLLASKVQSWYVRQSLQAVKTLKFPGEDESTHADRVALTDELKEVKDVFALDPDKKARVFAYYKQTLIDYYDKGRAHGLYSLPFYFMIGPYVEGVSLSRWMGENRANFDHIIGVFRFVVTMLRVLKQFCGFEHRDLSSSNIMMCDIAKTYKNFPVSRFAGMVFWTPNPTEVPVLIDFASARVSAATMSSLSLTPHADFISDGSTFSHDTRRLALHIAYATFRSLERSVHPDTSRFNITNTVQKIPLIVYDFCMCMLEFNIAEADCGTFKDKLGQFRLSARRVQSLFILFYKIVSGTTSAVVLTKLMQPVQLASDFLRAVRKMMSLLENVLMLQLKPLLTDLIPGSVSFLHEASTYNCDALKTWPLLFPPN
jgi:serine/threonine protein kinase